MIFLNNYSPRLNKIKKKAGYRVIKYSLSAIFIGIIFITFNISGNKNKVSFTDDFYYDTYSEKKNIVKIENAKLVGNDKNNRPYMITALSAIKNNINTNTMLLNEVEADVNLENKKWLLLKTKKATYNLADKILSSEELVKIYYDSGTSLESSNIKYYISSGLVTGNNGIIIFGSWGVINSDSFSFDINNQKFKFFNNPSMQINSR